MLPVVDWHVADCFRFDNDKMDQAADEAMNRRGFISTTTAALALPVAGFGADARPTFQQRGYYLCFMRMPTFGLAVWKEILDGEGLMHDDHCNSTIADSRLVNNRGNSYLSLFHVGAIDGLHIEGNDISTQAGDSDIYVTASRHKQPGDFPIKRVTVVKNITRTNGIRVQGWPAENVVVKDNRHLGAKPGKLIDEASADLANNTHYEVRSVAPLSLRKDAR